MKFDEMTLKNGLRIIGEKIPHFRSVSVGLWIESGSQYETPDIGGVSHFIEHMLFKGTKTRTAKEIAEVMDAVGGQLNAFTAKECTCFYAKVVDQHLPLALDVLTDLVRNSRFAPDDIQREKGVVIEEINMAEDTPEDLVYEQLMLAQYGDQPISRPILGTEETVSAMTREAILTYMARMYRPECCVLALAGNYDWDKVVEMAQNLLGDWQATGAPRPELTIAPTKPIVLRREKDIEQLHICLGYPAAKIGSDEVYPLSLFNSVYGGAMSSRLFQSIREEKGMAYTVYSYPNAYTGSGVLAVYAGTSTEHAPEVMRLIREETDKLVRDGLTEKEFVQSREQLKAGYILGLESTSSRMNSIGRRKLLLNSTQTENDVIAKIDAITYDEVTAVMRRVLTSPCSISLVGKGADALVLE